MALLLVSIAVVADRDRWSAGVLIGTGSLTVLHFAGVVVAAARAIGEVGDVRAGGFLGALGGLLALAGGVALAHRSRVPTDATR